MFRVSPRQVELLRRVAAARGTLVLGAPEDVRDARALVAEGLLRRPKDQRQPSLLQKDEQVELTEFGKRYLTAPRWSDVCRP